MRSMMLSLHYLHYCCGSFCCSWSRLYLRTIGNYSSLELWPRPIATIENIEVTSSVFFLLFFFNCPAVSQNLPKLVSTSSHDPQYSCFGRLTCLTSWQNHDKEQWHQVFFGAEKVKISSSFYSCISMEVSYINQMLFIVACSLCCNRAKEKETREEMNKIIDNR